MHWNHRVLESHTETGEPHYAIHEVYYDDSGKPISRSVDAVKPVGEDLLTLACELAMFRRALRKPVLSKTGCPRETRLALGRIALLRGDMVASFYGIQRFFRPFLGKMSEACRQQRMEMSKGVGVGGRVGALSLPNR